MMKDVWKNYGLPDDPDGSVTEDRVSITKKEYELFEKLKKIWFHTQPQWSNSYFICGEGGEHDTHGLPDTILVCPRMGENTTAIYRKEKVGRGGQ